MSGAHDGEDVVAHFDWLKDAIICFSRCMWCGRRTNHEWCHACTAKFNAGKRMRSDRWRFDQEPEPCSFPDEECPRAQVTRCAS